MKKIPKIKVGSNNEKPEGLLQHLGRYFMRGVLAGVLFQGTFMFLKFENRIVRGVTSGQLGSPSIIKNKLERCKKKQART